MYPFLYGVFSLKKSLPALSSLKCALFLKKLWVFLFNLRSTRNWFLCIVRGRIQLHFFNTVSNCSKQMYPFQITLPRSMYSPTYPQYKHIKFISNLYLFSITCQLVIHFPFSFYSLLRHSTSWASKPMPVRLSKARSLLLRSGNCSGHHSADPPLPF